MELELEDDLGVGVQADPGNENKTTPTVIIVLYVAMQLSQTGCSRLSSEGK